METVTQINTLKKSLNENKVQLGCWLTLCSSTVTEICANAGFDWLTIDTEHAPSDHDTVLRQLQAASGFSPHQWLGLQTMMQLKLKEY